jgi:hypothetical protein
LDLKTSTNNFQTLAILIAKTCFWITGANHVNHLFKGKWKKLMKKGSKEYAVLNCTAIFIMAAFLRRFVGYFPF